MPTLCCPACFDDRGLRKYIFPTLKPKKGTCNYCSSKNTDLVEPDQLSTYFELLLNVYEPATNGKPIIEWMKHDWKLFTNPKLKMMRAEQLLCDILNNKKLVNKPLKPSVSTTINGLIQWDTLRDEMMHQNRWFLEQKLDTDRLEGLLGHLPSDNLPDIWYRARLLRDSKIYPLEKMGAPPKREVSHGRANPAGIPYLYLGSLPETAVSEIRPHTSEKACVAEFEIKGPIRAVDLRAPRKLVSPFLLPDSRAIHQLRTDIPFLEKLGEELTRPVLPSSAAIDYIPSQYLCEFIKNCGYDGVVYSSSVSNGFNLALFDPDRAVGKKVTSYLVKSVSVTIKPN